jgi:hypothetical protein
MHNDILQAIAFLFCFLFFLTKKGSKKVKAKKMQLPAHLHILKNYATTSLKRLALFF